MILNLFFSHSVLEMRDMPLFTETDAAVAISSESQLQFLIVPNQFGKCISKKIYYPTLRKKKKKEKKKNGEDLYPIWKIK